LNVHKTKQDITMSIPGYATPEHTQQFAAQFSNLPKKAFRKLGRTGLTVGRLGFGTYRCHAEIPTHLTALRQALLSGVNLIDTSANYMDGMAEVLIGDLLNEFIVWDEHPREAYLVVSKVGYLQGENLDMAKEREQRNDPFPEVVKYQSDLWHCIHPAYIADQITRSLARMHLDVLDVYLLHNPEYILMQAAREGFDMGAVEKQFYNRLRRAFVQMEQLVAEGLIRWYGISSNSLVLPSDHPHFVNLAKVWNAYNDACLKLGITPEAGHFAVIQLPFNWVENGAATIVNNQFGGQEYTVLQLARKLNLGVLSNRPLNAIADNRLIRLADYGADDNTNYYQQFSDMLGNIEEQEEALVTLVAGENLQLGDAGSTFREFLQLSRYLRQLAEYEDLSIPEYQSVITDSIHPLMEFGSIVLRENSSNSEIPKVLERYLQLTQKAVEIWLNVLDQRNRERLQQRIAAFDARFPELAGLTLSQKALYQCLQQDEIDVVLNGMRDRSYVTDSLATLTHLK
jgi:hypothetical protein